MGNCSSVTTQQVTDDLEDALKQSAKNLLQKDFSFAISNNNSPSLQNYTHAIATHGFKNSFGYEWASSNCSPTNKYGTQVNPATDFCIISKDQDLSKGISAYVDQGLANAGLAVWMKRNATADLAEFITQCANYYCDNEWHYTSHTAKYNSSHTDEDSYQLDMELVYTNATRTESAVEVTLHIFYFVGVYYTVASPTKVAYGDVQGTAYSKAVDLLSEYLTLTVNSYDQLDFAILQDTAWKFCGRWGYSQSDGKPSDYPKNESDALYTKTKHLFYFPNTTHTDAFLNNYVQLHIMNALNVPITTAKDSIQNDIKTAFHNILVRSDSADWSRDYIDKTYELKKATVNPIRMNAVVSYFTDSKTITVTDTYGSQQSVSVRIAYLFFLGVVYELAPDDIAQDLTRQLCINLGVQASSLPSNITPAQFISYVEAKNAEEFRDKYGFSFPLTGQSTDSHIAYWKAFFEFDTLNPSKDDIEAKVKYQLLDPGDGGTDKGDGKINNGNEQTVYDFIVDAFEGYAGTSYSKDSNHWYSELKETNIQYSGKKKKHNLDVRTAWEFVDGTITKNADTLQRFYLSLLLYISVSDIDS